MPINKITYILLTVVTVALFWFIGSYDNPENQITTVSIIKLSNQIFNGLLVLGFALLILFTFNRNGNYEAKKISESPLALSLLLGLLFLAIATAIASI